MYINFKSKYKKIIWFIIGFLLACFYIQKVNAYTMPNGLEITDTYIQNLWDTYLSDKTPHDLNNSCPVYNSLCNHTYNESNTPFNFVYVGYINGYTHIFFARFQEEIVFDDTGGTGITGFSFNANIKQYSNDFNDIKYNNYPFLIISSDKTTVFTNYYNGSTITYFRNSAGINNYDSLGNFTNFALNFNLVRNDNILKEFNFTYPSTGPSYLTGYKKITLTTDDKYYMLSGLSTGSIFIPLEDFYLSGGRLSYYDNDLSSQPYTSYIQDYTITSDGLYARQDFNLNNYYGADFVMFSKYIYLEGEDDISYDIWVPNDIYDSQVTITPNSSGGNTFDFDYEDSNGDIQNGQVNSVDLSQDNPLLGNIFTDFSSNTFGLTSIVTSPLSLISSLSSTNCSNLSVPLPYISSNLTLPCMSSIYSNTFGSFFNLYQTITTGIISYWVIVKIFNLVKDFKNPDHDEIEVIDL